MKVKTLMCTCRGGDAFRFADMNSAPDVESEAEISFNALHAELCEPGNQFLQEVLRAAEDDSDTFVVACNCTEETPGKPLKNLLHKADFASERFVPPDFRKPANEGILDRIGQRLHEIADPNKARH